MSQDTKPIQLTRRPGQEYTDEEIDQGLTMVAICSGNTRRAAAELKRNGKPIPRTTLETWSRQRRDRLEEVERKVLPGLRMQLARENEDLASSLLDVMRENAAKLAEKVNDPDLSFKERSDAAYKLSLSQGIVVDKSLTLRGDPTQITEHRTVHETLNGLKRLGVVESTATELPDPA